MPDPHFLVQTEISRDLDIAGAAAALGAAITPFSGRDAKDILPYLDRDLENQTPILFCSLPVAAQVKRHHKSLARGLILQPEFLKVSTWSALLPIQMLLNPGGIFLPWGRILPMREPLHALFGEKLFIRPDSSLKPFTGFVATRETLEAEISATTQTSALFPEELCYIVPARNLAELEYRTWIVDGEPVASSSYSWTEGLVHGPAPQPVLEAARAVAATLQMREQVFVADFVETAGGTKLVELNAMSTSGWYPGVDLPALLQAVAGLYA